MKEIFLAIALISLWITVVFLIGPATQLPPSQISGCVASAYNAERFGGNLQPNLAVCSEL